MNDYLDQLRREADAAGATVGQEPSDYLGALRKQADAVGAQSLRATVNTALTINPDVYAQQKAQASRLGVTPMVVETLPAEMAARDRLRKIEADTAQAPTLKLKYSDADFAKLAHDDSSALGGIEAAIGKAVRYVMGADGRGGLPGDVAAGAFGASRSAAGMGQAAAELVAPAFDALEPDDPNAPRRLSPRIVAPLPGGNPLRRVAEGFAMIGAEADATKKRLGGRMDGIVSGGVSSGVQSLTQNLLALPMALLPGGQLAALTMLAGGAGGQSYQDAREKGLPMSVALPFGASQAAIEYATEKLPLSRLIGDVKAGTGLLKTMAQNAALEIPGEQIATVLQDMNEWAVLNPEKPFSSYLADRPSAAAQTLIATLIGVGGQVTVMRGIERVMGDGGRMEFLAQQAEQAAQQAEALTKLRQASKYASRDAAGFKELVAEIADENGDAPTEFYVDGQQLLNTLNQSGVSRVELEAIAPVVAAQIEAAMTGADVRVPVSEFMTAPDSITAPLIDHLRSLDETGELGMTRAEAKTYMAEQGDSLRAEMEAELSKMDTQSAFRESIAGVQQRFQVELDAAGRFRPDVNKAYASLLANFYGTQAARLGMTPDDLMQRYGLRVAAKGVAGARMMEQAGGLTALRQQWTDAGIKSAASESGGIITLSQIVVPEGERGAGKGTEAMQALVDYADRTGQSIALSPSADFGGNKNRLTDFYKRFGFVENKGKNRAFTVSESMYRPAPGRVLEQGQLESSAQSEAEQTKADVIALRKREAVLKSLLECIGG